MGNLWWYESAGGAGSNPVVRSTDDLLKRSGRLRSIGSPPCRPALNGSLIPPTWKPRCSRRSTGSRSRGRTFGTHGVADTSHRQSNGPGSRGRDAIRVRNPRVASQLVLLSVGSKPPAVVRAIYFDCSSPAPLGHEEVGTELVPVGSAEDAVRHDSDGLGRRQVGLPALQLFPDHDFGITAEGQPVGCIALDVRRKKRTRDQAPAALIGRL